MVRITTGPLMAAAYIPPPTARLLAGAVKPRTISPRNRIEPGHMNPMPELLGRNAGRIEHDVLRSQHIRKSKSAETSMINVELTHASVSSANRSPNSFFSAQFDDAAG